MGKTTENKSQNTSSHPAFQTDSELNETVLSILHREAAAGSPAAEKKPEAKAQPVTETAEKEPVRPPEKPVSNAQKKKASPHPHAPHSPKPEAAETEVTETAVSESAVTEGEAPSENVSFSAPFLRCFEKRSSFAADLFLAALPILGARIWYFGWRTVTVLLLALLVSLVSAFLFAVISRKDPVSALKSALSEGNFAVTALTVTLISSPNMPFFAVFIVCAAAEILFKGVFGLRSSAVRSHPLNPAMAAFSLLMLLCQTLDGIGAVPGVHAPLFLASPDPAVYGAGNPILAALRSGVLPSAPPVSIVLGNAAGLVPAVFVLFSLVYLLIRKTVAWQIPCTMLLAGVVFAALLPETAIVTDMILLQSVLFEIFSGTFFICALFCGADTATVPYTGTGKLIFGALAGTFTILLRHHTGIVNCAPIGVIAANALTPIINRLTLPRPFGKK